MEMGSFFAVCAREYIMQLCGKSDEKAVWGHRREPTRTVGFQPRPARSSMTRGLTGITIKQLSGTLTSTRG